MPNYLLIPIIILLNISTSYSQYEKRKMGVDKDALNKIIQRKVEALKEDVALSHNQVQKIKKIYTQEVYKIDSLKFLSPEFYEDPLHGRDAIMMIKQDSEEAIQTVLTFEQKRTLVNKRIVKKKKALERLQQVKK